MVIAFALTASFVGPEERVLNLALIFVLPLTMRIYVKRSRRVPRGFRILGLQPAVSLTPNQGSGQIFQNSREQSSGRLFVDAFLDNNLVDFDECRANYESMTPDELVHEMTFLFSRQTSAIPFELSANRYYAFLVSLIHCTANYRYLTNHQRSHLVNAAIDVCNYAQNRTAEDKREAFNKALYATLNRERKFGLFPLVADLIADGTRNYKGEFPINSVGEILERKGNNLS